MCDRTPSGETRAGTLWRHVRLMQLETGCSMQSLATRVVEHYHATVPPQLREIAFRFGGDVFRDAQTNAQHLSRWMDPASSARAPIEIEESVVAVLGGHYTVACRRDMARRYGLLDVPVPESTACDLVAVGALTARLGDVLQAIGPALNDGRLDADDMEHLPAVVRELDSLCAAALALKARVKQIKRGGRSA